MRSLVGRVAVGIAALGLVAALGACGPVKMGAAAIVGDRRIPTSEVDAAAREITKGAPADAVRRADVPASVTRVRIVDLLTRELAERDGVGYTQGAVERKYQGRTLVLPLNNGAQAPMPKAEERRLKQSSYLQERLADELGGDEAFGDRLSELAVDIGVEVNPRYGEFDPETINIRPTYGGLWVPSRSAG